MPAISIIIPVYNTPQKYLETCLRSVWRQTLPDYEALVIDDGSNEETRQLCERLAAQDARVRVIHQPNGGVSSARNRGMDEASGTYLLFLDPDDWLSRDALERSYQKIEQSGADLLIFTHYDHFGKEKIRRRLFRKGLEVTEITPELKRNMQLGLMDRSVRDVWGYFGACWTQLIRTSLVREHQLRFDLSLRKSQDMAFDLELLNCTDRIDFLDAALYHYRHYKDSITSRYNPEIAEILAPLNHWMARFVRENGPDYQPGFDYRLADNYQLCLTLDLFHRKNRAPNREKRAKWRRLISHPAYAPYFETMDYRTLYQKNQTLGAIAFLSFRVRSFLLLRVYLLWQRWKQRKTAAKS